MIGRISPRISLRSSFAFLKSASSEFKNLRKSSFPLARLFCVTRMLTYSLQRNITRIRVLAIDLIPFADVNFKRIWRRKENSIDSAKNEVLSSIEVNGARGIPSLQTSGTRSRNVGLWRSGVG